MKKVKTVDFSETIAASDLKNGLLHIIVCSNDDHGVTLAYFTARSNFVIWAFP